MKTESNLIVILFCSLCVIFSSCTSVQYSRVGQVQSPVIGEANDPPVKAPIADVNVPVEEPEYKVVYRKSNLEALAIGRNRIEIEALMGEPEGKSLDGGNGYLWDYRRPVYDESTEVTYGWSLISFKFLKGLCAYVNINLEQLPPEMLKSQN